MATLTATGGTKQVSLSGTGYTGSTAIVSVNFSTAGRRYIELRSVPVSGGNVSTAVPVPYAGTVTVAAHDPLSYLLQIAANSVTVT